MTRFLYALIVLTILYDNCYCQEWNYYSSLTHHIPNDHVNSVFIDENNTKWFGTNEGLVSYDGIEWTIHPIDARINNIYGNQNNHSNEIWLSTDTGLIVVQASTASSITILNHYHDSNSDIIHNSNLNISFDNTSFIWLGSLMGISIFDGENWLNFTEDDSVKNVQDELISIVPFNKVMDLKHRENGMVITDKTAAYKYIATEGAGINRLKYDEIDGITSASKFDTEWSQLPSDTINTMYFDSGNTAWYGTNQGLSMHSGNNIKRNWVTFTKEDGLINDTVLIIMEDRNTNIWIGTADGVSVFNREQWNSWDTKIQAAGDSVNAIVEDSTGTIWLCTNNGILEFKPVITSISADLNSSITDLNLNSYPNPFNSTTVIKYTIKQSEFVHLDIFDMLGKKVTSLVDTKQRPGNYRVKFKAENLVSGIYFCRLLTKKSSITKRLLLIK